MKLFNILSTFDAFEGKELLGEQERQHYASAYIELYYEFKNMRKGEAEDVNNDIAFEMELIKQDVQAVDYEYPLKGLHIVEDAGKLGTNALYNGNAWISFVIEAILTCIFVLAILGVTSKKEYSNIAGLVIGGALTLVHLLGINFTGTSVNPARSFGPALIAGNLSGIWVFLLAPLAGGVLAAVIYGFLADEKN